MAKCIIISGIDGSGKSTIINETQIALEAEGKKVGYIWLRFNHYLTKGMHAIARVLGLSVKVHNEMGDVWQHRLYKNQVFCSLYILTTYLDSWMSRLKYNRMAKGKDTVICDRWITDILVDLATKTHRKDFLDSRWPKRFMKILPEGVRMFVVVRNTEALIDCRLENRVDPNFEFRLGIYEDLCKKDYVTVVDNNGTIANSVKQIIDRL
ncbi:thymidylate kinase [Bacteroides finegoldii]|uniref:thymidylate kinase n=1 Tax=Bacteroides finegoldii TaxID=338188 RepID=UPI0018A110D4|nr:thymidylate kinase [Bacteroides finegoldii]